MFETIWEYFGDYSSLFGIQSKISKLFGDYVGTILDYSGLFVDYLKAIQMILVLFGDHSALFFVFWDDVGLFDDMW